MNQLHPRPPAPAPCPDGTAFRLMVYLMAAGAIVITTGSPFAVTISEGARFRHDTITVRQCLRALSYGLSGVRSPLHHFAHDVRVHLARAGGVLFATVGPDNSGDRPAARDF